VAKAELPFEQRLLASGRGARVLGHDDIGPEIPRSVSIGLVPAAQLVAIGGDAVLIISLERRWRVHTRTEARAALSARVVREALGPGAASRLAPRRRFPCARPRPDVANADLPLEHRVFARGRGARVLAHKEIGLEAPNSDVSIGLMPVVRLTAGADRHCQWQCCSADRRAPVLPSAGARFESQLRACEANMYIQMHKLNHASGV